MRILFLHRNLPPDSYTGVAIQVHRLANALTNLGHEVQIYTHSKRPKDALYQVLPIEFPGLKFALKLAPFLKRIWFPLWYRKLSHTNFDVFHIHGDGGFLKYTGSCVRTFYGTAGMEYFHARNIKAKIAQGFSHWMEKREVKRCRLTVGISPHIETYLSGIDQVIPCMLSESPELEMGGKSTEPSVLFIGSRFSRKRGEKALEIYLTLKIKFPKIKLTYISSTEEVSILTQDKKYHGIQFLSKINQDELNNIYRNTWIYLSLSSYEGFGVSIIEAMAYSCLVISTPHAGGEFILKNGNTGIISPIEKVKEILNDIICDTPSRLEISRRARIFSQSFSPQYIAQKYLELYKIAQNRTIKPIC